MDQSPIALWCEPGQIWNAPKSAFRVLHILELLVTSGKPLRAKEIGLPLNLSPSSTNQLLKTMVDWAYLIFDPISKKYSLSPRLMRLGDSLSNDYFGFGAIDGLMRRLQRTFNAAVALSTSQGAFIQTVDILRPQKPAPWLKSVPSKAVIGLKVPLFASGAGVAWLSCQSREMILTAIRLCRRELGAQADDVGSILAQTRRVKEQGYALGGLFNYRAPSDQSRSLSLPLPPTPNGIVLVITISAAREEVEENHHQIASFATKLIRQHLNGRFRSR